MTVSCAVLIISLPLLLHFLTKNRTPLLIRFGNTCITRKPIEQVYDKGFTIHSMFLEIHIKFDHLKKRPTRHIAQLSYNLILRMNIEKQSLE